MRRSVILALVAASACSLEVGGIGAAPTENGSGDAAVEGAASDVAQNDGGEGDAAAPGCPTLEVSLDHGDRSDGGDGGDAGTPPIVVVASVKSASGGLAGLTVKVSATGGTAGAVDDRKDGTYAALVTPSDPSGEVPIGVEVTANGCALSAHETAVVLPTVDGAWAQPVALRGAVNTPGYEDGPSVSPDGEWLIVTDYSPVDMVCCHTGCTTATPMDPQSAFCQTSLGPYAAPLRPDFPGADRIVAHDHIVNACPKACYTADYTADGGELTNVPVPPIGSYLFHRQPDGSFGEPAFVGYDADGCAVPTGESFVGPTSATSGNILYAWRPPYGGTTNMYVAPIALGTKNVLGTLSCTGSGQVSFSGMVAAQLSMTLGQQDTNAVFRGNVLWFDDLAAYPHVMHFAQASAGALGASTTFTPSYPSYPVVAAGSSYDDREQPFLHEASSTLYYVNGAKRVVAAPMTGTDPSWVGSFGAQVTILSSEPGGRTGSITAVGQPTIAARPDGKDELYFVYAVRTATGIDMNVGRVRKR